jgi:hypothetical protein
MTDLCYQLVVTIYVILQATLEFYKNVLCDALQNQPDLCVIIYFQHSGALHLFLYVTDTISLYF